MIKIFGSVSTFFLILISFACQTAPETKTENPVNSNNPAALPKPERSAEKSAPTAIDVPKLADKSSAELDRMFDKIREGKTVDPVGEFRLYKIAGQPKGLAVRFYGGKAKNFNLILDKSFPTSKEALKQIFNIDVDAAAAVKGDDEPLTEQFRGSFGGVKFRKVSAKREGNGKGFIFVLAEVAE